MGHRNLRREDFVGKTVIDFECDAVNIIRFAFDDGTKLAIEVDALGHGIYGMVACTDCIEEINLPSLQKPRFTQSVYIPKEELMLAVTRWLRLPVSSLPTFIGPRQDLYLRIVADAASCRYEDIARLWTQRESGVQEARRWVKRAIFRQLCLHPVSVLQVHDEQIIASSSSPVESGNAHQELANRAR